MGYVIHAYSRILTLGSKYLPPCCGENGAPLGFPTIRCTEVDAYNVWFDPLNYLYNVIRGVARTQIALCGATRRWGCRATTTRRPDKPLARQPCSLLHSARSDPGRYVLQYVYIKSEVEGIASVFGSGCEAERRHGLKIAKSKARFEIAKNRGRFEIFNPQSPLPTRDTALGILGRSRHNFANHMIFHLHSRYRASFR
jgi:hypothetical protein